MPYTDAAKNVMLDAVVGKDVSARPKVLYVSAHPSLPDASGAPEVSGGSYARQGPLVWADAAAGTIDTTSTPAIPIPAGTTVTHLGFWSAATAGTFMAYAEITAETFGSAGTLNVNDADLDLNT